MAEALHVDKFISKCFITVLVIVINYFTGKSTSLVSEQVLKR